MKKARKLTVKQRLNNLPISFTLFHIIIGFFDRRYYTEQQALDYLGEVKDNSELELRMYGIT